MKLCLCCMTEYNDEFDICPNCGYVDGTPAEQARFLTPGTVLQGKYIVGVNIGQGGFGVTYAAFDASLKRKRAIKEYLPSEFSTRTEGIATVMVHSDDKTDYFNEGVEKFVSEAQRLAKQNKTDGIVKVYDCFYENNTAYIVMEYLEGETLEEKLQPEISPSGEKIYKNRLSFEKATEIMMPVLDALSVVHKSGLIHRDISPDNIFITNDGKVKLIDFGAARYATSSNSKSLTTIVKPGFSPIEQYRSKGNQGSWTDVYSCAATLYSMVCGCIPVEANERFESLRASGKDSLVPPSKLGIDLYEDKKRCKNAETALLNALNVKAEDRTQTAGEFKKELQEKGRVKPKGNTVKKFDIGSWPLWAKIGSGIACSAVVTVIALVMTGVIHFDFTKSSGKYVIQDGYVRVPYVIGSNLSEAGRTFENIGLLYQVTDKKYSDEIPEDRILTQSIEDGIVVPEGAAVDLTVSGGREKIYIEDMSGTDAEETKRLLEEQGFICEIIEEESAVIAPGSLIRIEDESKNVLTEGQAVEKGTKLILVVSTGRGDIDENKDVSVPDFKGMTWEEAQKAAEEAGLYLKKGEQKYSDSIPKGEVMDQKLAAGTSVKQGSIVELTVSLGVEMVRMPDLQYKSVDEAETMLTSLGLKYEVVYEDNNEVAKDRVIRQSVSTGEEVKKGASVTLYISRGNAAIENAPKVDVNTAPHETQTSAPTVIASNDITKPATPVTPKEISKTPTKTDDKTTTTTVSKPVTKTPVTEPVTKPLTNPVTKPVTEPVTLPPTDTPASIFPKTDKVTFIIDNDGVMTIMPEYGDSGILDQNEFSDFNFPDQTIDKSVVKKICVKPGCTIWCQGYLGNLFNGYENVEQIDLTGFNTVNVTSMCSMFANCSSLKSLDLSSFDTVNVSKMQGFFSGCSSITSLNLSGFDTVNVTDMGYMFYGCSSLTSIDLSSFDTLNVIDMEAMFCGCSSLKNLDLSSFDTRNVTTLNCIFENCSSLKNLDLSNFDTVNVTDMGFMFRGCSSLKSLDLSSFDTVNVTSMWCMFYGCSSLSSIDLSSFDTVSVTEMSNMFNGCSSLSSLDLSSFDTVNVTSMKGMFWGCSSLSSLDLSSFDTVNISSEEELNNMFNECSSLTNLICSDDRVIEEYYFWYHKYHK